MSFFTFKRKIAIDVSLSILLLCCMAYHLTGNSGHEWIGTVFLIVFTIHQAANIRWYKNLFKGKYSYYRTILCVVNFLLLISVAAVAVSGICMSREVFFFIPRIGNLMLLQKIHMTATSWLFVLSACHLGLHWHIFVHLLRKIKYVKLLAVARTLTALSFVMFGYGVYQYINRSFHLYMFLLAEYPIFDFNESFLVFIFDYIMLMSCFVFVFYYLTKYLPLLNKK